MSQPSDVLAHARHVVTAVLVSHDGARWLPRALDAVKGQRRAVQRFVVVDTASRDDSREIAVAAVGGSAVLTAPRTATFGAAVASAIDALTGAPGLASTRAEEGEPVEWLWLLHDDCAPDPDALLHLLELSDQMPSVGVLGVKQRGWSDADALVNVGFTVDRGGRRERGLERGEIDQGQHDQVRDVLAVGSAGMLVRRDVWDALGGFDGVVPMFRDDLDFCWRARRAGYRVVICPAAVVFHAQAAAAGQRPLAVGSRRPRRMDREAALRILLTHSSSVGVHLNAVRLLLASVLRAVVMVLAKRPAHAWDELSAVVRVFGRPDRMFAARRRLRAVAALPSREASRGLLAPPGSLLRHRTESMLAALGARPASSAPAVPRSGGGRDARVAIETGLSEAPEDLTGSTGVIRAVFTRPGVMITLALLLVALIAERSLLGSGALFGGALLPAPNGASDLWDAFVRSWHPVGLGSDTPASPALAVLAGLATLLLGHAGLAVGVLLLGSVPLAGIAAYLAAGTVVRAPRRRMWAAAAYALLPVMTGAIAAGRLGVSVAVVLLPFVVVLVARATLPLPAAAQAIGSPDYAAAAATGEPRRASIRAAWGAAVLLAVATAFEPVTYALVGVVALVAGILAVTRRRWRGVAGACVVVVMTPLLLLPWSWDVASHPARLLLGLGRLDPSLTERSLSSVGLFALQPGGPAPSPSWLYGALFLAAVAALARGRHRRVAGASWILIGVGLVGAVVISRVSARVNEHGSAPGWPGVAIAMLALGLITAALAASHGLRVQLRAQSFGWRQPAGVIVALAAIAAPIVVGVGWMVRGAGQPLLRGGSAVVPDLLRIRNDLAGESGRSLVLRPESDDALTYTLVRGDSSGPTLGDAALRFDPSLRARVDAAVADLAGGGGAAAVAPFVADGVRYVVLQTPTGDAAARATAARLRATLSNAGGLVADTVTSSVTVWQLPQQAHEVALVDPTHGTRNAMERLAGAADSPTGAFNVPYSPYVRYVALAEAPGDRWRATIDGKPLDSLSYFGTQAFEVPAGAGRLTVSHDPAGRGPALLAELAAVVVAVILTFPGARRAVEAAPAPDVEASRHGRGSRRERARAGAAAGKS